MKQDLGKLLLENEQINSVELELAIQKAVETGEPVGSVLLRLGLVNEDIIKTVLELHYAVNYFNLKKIEPDLNLVGLFPWDFLVHNQLVPISKEDNRLTIAMLDPLDNKALNLAKAFLPNWQFRPVVCSDDSFHNFLARATPKKTGSTAKSFQTESAVTVYEGATFGSGFISLDEEPNDANDQDAAMIRLCNHVLSNAIARGCTNIHIEPTDKQILVHYRKEGVLFSARKLPKAILPELTKRFKNMSSTSSESPPSLPYDGRLSIRHNGENFFFRLSIVPGAYGEHLVVWLE